VPSEIGQARRPRPTRAKGAIDRGDALESVRSITRRAVKDFVGHRHRNRGKALLLASSPGAGKTSAVAEAVRDSGASARIVAGTKRLARELAETHGYRLISGRNAESCERMDVVDALGESGHDIGRLACGTLLNPRCPFRDRCGYWAQFNSIGPRVGATEQLFNPKFLQGGDVIVVDDADLARAMVERKSLGVEQIARTVEQLKGKRWESVRDLLGMVQHAIVDAPRREDGQPASALMGAQV